MMITSSASRAPVTTSTMSSWHHCVSSPLIRIARMVRPQSRSVSAATAVARADSFAAGAQASSRSRNTRSAPARAATSHMCSLLAGVASSLRRGRDGWDIACSVRFRWCPRHAGRQGGRRRDRAGRGTPSSLSAPSARPRWLTRPGVSLKRATGACTVIVPTSGSSIGTKVPRARRCSSASSCCGVVNRCGRDILGEEHLHRIVERVCADPGRRRAHRSRRPVPGAESGRRTRDGLQGRVCRWRGRGARRRSTMHSRSRASGRRRCGRRFVVRWRRRGFRCGPGSGPSWS